MIGFGDIRNLHRSDLSEYEQQLLSIRDSLSALDCHYRHKLDPGNAAELLRRTCEKIRPEVSHAEDFTSVVWFSTGYTFAMGQQARAVGLLWGAWEAGGHGLSQLTIADKIGSASDRFRMAQLFRDHEAYGTMIQHNGQGVYRLVPPE